MVMNAGIPREIVDHVNAIFALEGFAPDALKREIDAALVAGLVAPGEVIDRLKGHIKATGSVAGFVVLGGIQGQP